MFTAAAVLFLGFFLPARAQVYLNQWAVHIPGGEDEARHVARRHGFTFHGQIGTLDDYYLLEHHHVSRRSTSAAPHHHSSLQADHKVLWAEQQVVKKRVKRDLLPGLPASVMKFQDPYWDKMWYLHGGARGGFDMNVIPVWQRGYTGKGVVITILDDGIEHNHTDLIQNYDPDASWDINNNDPDPMPKYDNVDTNRHGTRCAGEVAATANNTRCVIGVAYNAKIGGVRMLDGDVSDYVEAQSLSLNPQHVDIYSASWGPDDNGKVVDGPAKLAKEAFIQGVLKGRGGKGSIFVWASGNGGSQHDSCDCDGYTNSIFTLSISSASEKGTKPWYLEECSSTLATTYSSGQNYGEKKIVTTDLHDKCTTAHTGTSASAPLAAGIIALALEANPDLSWRDMQYLVLMTARPEPLIDGDWSLNGVNRKVSHKYGYGLMDAAALVDLAEHWTPVPEQRICTTQLMELDRTVNGNGLMVKVDTNGCEGTPNHVRFVEHVQAKVSIEFSSRGDLQIFLVSPNNTRSTLLQKRKNDYQEGTFSNWPFMSVHFWGENPAGTWRLEIVNTGPVTNTGLFGSWQLIMYGTSEQPVSLHEPKLPPAGKPNKQEKEHEKDQEHEKEQEKGKNNKSEENESWLPKWNTDDDVKQMEDYNCHSECNMEAGCNGPLPADCVTCKHIRLAEQGDCVEKCPVGMYADAKGGVCHACAAPCLTCDGPHGILCQSCLHGYYYLAEENNCLPRCPSAYYADANTGSCETCSLECQSCVGNASNCTSCSADYEMINEQCLPLCRSNQYRDTLGRCKDCYASCLTCAAEGSSVCLTCQPSLLYQNGSCLEQCGLGYYQHLSREYAICKRCSVSCESCNGEGEDKCTSCASGLKLQAGKCVSSCAPGLYEDAEGKCLPCNEYCASCHGASKTDCLSCSALLYLWHGECIEACPSGSYVEQVASGEQCRDCHLTCSDCSGPEISQCLACDPGLYLHQGSCHTHCPPGTFVSKSECRQCDKTCGTCMGPDAIHCLTCTTDRVLLDNQCLETCPQGYYAMEGRCHHCGTHCRSCSTSTDHPCLSCDTGFLVVAGQCVPDDSQLKHNCPSSTYWNTQSKSCESCDESCSTCQGPGPNNCLSCDPPRRYYSRQHRCVLCCSISLTQGCCNCHPNTGVCMENRNTEEEPSSLTLHQGGNSKLSDSPTSSSSSSFSSSIYKVALTRSLGVSSLTVAVVSLCVVSVIIFVLVFLLLQARSSDRACWTPRYQPVPTFYQNGTDKVVINREMDSPEEEEEYTA